MDGPGSGLGPKGGKRAEEGHAIVNIRVMVKARLTGAVSDTPGMKLVVEGKIVGNALRLDPQGPRRDERHLRLAKAAAGTMIADQRLASPIADDVARASPTARGGQARHRKCGSGCDRSRCG